MQRSRGPRTITSTYREGKTQRVLLQDRGRGKTTDRLATTFFCFPQVTLDGSPCDAAGLGRHDDRDRSHPPELCPEDRKHDFGGQNSEFCPRCAIVTREIKRLPLAPLDKIPRILSPSERAPDKITTGVGTPKF